jgi:ComF family protein
MKIAQFCRRAGEALLSLVYPPHCAACGTDTPAGEHLCEPCASTVRRIEPPFCAVCSQPFDGAIEGEFTCANCGDREFYFEHAVSRCLSRGVVRDFIHRFKYDKHLYLRHRLAQWLAESLDDERIRGRPFDALVPVPLHATRKRQREFNQAEILADLLSRRTKAPLLHCLVRTRDTPTQTRLDREERMENLRGAFQVRHTPRVLDRHLLLVDDVLTTGSTVDECARVLCEAGAASIRVVTVARG